MGEFEFLCRNLPKFYRGFGVEGQSCHRRALPLACMLCPCMGSALTFQRGLMIEREKDKEMRGILDDIHTEVSIQCRKN